MCGYVCTQCGVCGKPSAWKAPQASHGSTSPGSTSPGNASPGTGNKAMSAGEEATAPEPILPPGQTRQSASASTPAGR